jgi:hypothetical protein
MAPASDNDNLNRIFMELETIREQLRDITATISASIGEHSTMIGRIEERDALLHKAIEEKFALFGKDLDNAFGKIKALESVAMVQNKAIDERFKVYESLQDQAKGAARLWRLLASACAAAAAGIEFWMHFGRH